MYNFVKCVYQKIVFLCDLLIKKFEHPPVCCGVIVYYSWLGATYDSQVTNRSAAEGGGVLQGVLFESVGRMGVIYGSQLHGYTLF
jgi:hypothetical protein